VAKKVTRALKGQQARMEPPVRQGHKAPKVTPALLM